MLAEESQCHVCISGLLMHDILHDSMLSVENFRPIVLASLAAKVLQQIIFYRLQEYI